MSDAFECRLDDLIARALGELREALAAVSPPVMSERITGKDGSTYVCTVRSGDGAVARIYDEAGKADLWAATKRAWASPPPKPAKRELSEDDRAVHRAIARGGLSLGDNRMGSARWWGEE